MDAPKADKRLFVAIALPLHVKRELIRHLPDALTSGLSANLHLTLRFIGSVTCIEPYREQLRHVHIRPFELRLGDTGFLRKSILYVSPYASAPLSELKIHIDRELGKIGLPADPRPFLPHITLRRFRNGPPGISAKKLGAINPELHWQIDSFCLFRSYLNHNGARHELLEKYWAFVQ